MTSPCSTEPANRGGPRDRRLVGRGFAGGKGHGFVWLLEQVGSLIDGRRWPRAEAAQLQFEGGESPLVG